MVLIQTTEDNVKFYALNMLHDLAHDYTNSEERIKNLVIAYNEFFTQHGGFNKQSSNHGKPWKKVQNDKLKSLVAQKKSNELIAEEMGRSIRSIEMQRERLGLH